VNGAQKATIDEIRSLLKDAASINSTRKAVEATELLLGMVEDVIAAHDMLAESTAEAAGLAWRASKGIEE
jgi:hypothetical protein